MSEAKKPCSNSKCNKGRVRSTVPGAPNRNCTICNGSGFAPVQRAEGPRCRVCAKEDGEHKAGCVNYGSGKLTTAKLLAKQAREIFDAAPSESGDRIVPKTLGAILEALAIALEGPVR